MPGRPLHSCHWSILPDPGHESGVGLIWACCETGEMPTIKQLQLWIFLIISEEKNGQADGVRQNEKWKQLGRTEEGGHQEVW